MPIYILTEQMSEKIKCPERDSNPRHPDLMEGALTTELPRQPQWSESNICYKGNIDYQTFAPRPLQTGNYSIIIIHYVCLLMGTFDHTDV